MTTVLLVDDDRAVRLTCAMLLTEVGFEVVSAESVDGALAELERAGGVDVVLSDVVLPGESGLRLLEIVSTRWPAVAVILFSGQPNLATASQALKFGAYDYLAKPLTLERMQTAIAEALVRREHRWGTERPALGADLERLAGQLLELLDEGSRAHGLALEIRSRAAAIAEGAEGCDVD